MRSLTVGFLHADILPLFSQIQKEPYCLCHPALTSVSVRTQPWGVEGRTGVAVGVILVPCHWFSPRPLPLLILDLPTNEWPKSLQTLPPCCHLRVGLDLITPLLAYWVPDLHRSRLRNSIHISQLLPRLPNISKGRR